MFEVPAGGRRYRPLELLVKQKRLAKTATVPCVIGDANSDILVDEVSLVENMERAPLHPLDQFNDARAAEIPVSCRDADSGVDQLVREDGRDLRRHGVVA